ncbi:hypothetical protein AK812_SmicGene3637 [Symbiodinium microadriaticum]|uniref:Integrase catalytic domain-containing protein n=1 Tax=Symbiodinium microadriaticum TaxID=2951 RepID=A0A1Q9EYG6_SYMMI|nr:hypothetical protein AK812_SmicGene3637 [Symbiodinium microadriaticum]
MAKRLMAMTTLVAASMSRVLINLHLEGCDGLWEVACAPHSWLSDAAERRALHPRRINLQQGYDLYKKDTWNELRRLRQQRRPRRLWFSLPCTKWCSWTSVNYNNDQRREQLETDRRKERRMLWEVVKFIVETMDDDPSVQVYFEWPFPCFGWRQQPLQHLEAELYKRGLAWLQCRVDGCCYGLRDRNEDLFVQKKWMIKTTDELFHQRFRSKVCPGNHRHAHIEGQETARTAYYPWKMVESITKFWADQVGSNDQVRQLRRADEESEVTMDEEAKTGLELKLAEKPDELPGEPMDLCVGQAALLEIEAHSKEALAYGRYGFPDCEGLLYLIYNHLGVTIRQDHTRWANVPAQRLQLGVYSFGGFGGVTNQTNDYEAVTKYVNGFLKHHLPQLTWTSLMINFNGRALPHKDHHNLKGSVNVLVGFGPYVGGGLCLQGQCDERAEESRRQMPDGTFAKGGIYDTHHKFVIFNPEVAKFHKAAGHPSNRNLARMLHDAGHPQWKVDVAATYECPTCQSLKMGGTSSGKIPPASTHAQYSPWEAVAVDAAEWVPAGRKVKVKFLLFMDVATKLRVTCPLYVYDFLEMKAESSQDFMQNFTERWLGTYPKPRVVLMDSAKSLISETTHQYLSDLNIMVHFIAEKESWAHGTVEAAVQDVKMTASAIASDIRHLPPELALHLATSALNSTEFTAGFSSFQWAFGKHYSLSDEDVRTFATTGQNDDFTRVITLRQQAEEIAVRTRARRVLSRLHNTTVRQPLREFQPFDLVKIWRHVWPHEQIKGTRGGFRKSGRPHWAGPGRVIFQEVLPHQERGDERRHIVWVLIGQRLFRCSVRSVRPVTEEERFVHETTSSEDPSSWRTLADILPRREYFDVVNEEPGEADRELPELPPEPDSTTQVAPTRRVRAKTTLTTIPPTTDEGTHHSTASSSQTHQREPPDVNDYEQPAVKRSKGEEPSWVEELYVEAEMEKNSMDIFHAMAEVKEFLRIEMDMDYMQSNRQKKMFVVLSKLRPEERELFVRAKAKEVDSFLRNEAVRKCLDNDEVKKAYDSGRIVKARWVLTWKLVPPEDRDEALRDRQENTQTLHTKDGSKKAKARIVLPGFQHPNLLDPSFKTASPVQSMLGRNLLYLMSAQHQWPLEGLDLATAFLQTLPTEADKELWTTGVEELREAIGVGPEQILRILRNIYGSTTAPRGLWLDLHKTLTSLGAQPVLGERCLWIWLQPDETEPRTIGAMGGHVDDFHRLGDDSPAWMAIKAKVDAAYKWGTAKKGNYRHAGTDISTVTDESGRHKIVVDQSYYVDGISDLAIDPLRLRGAEELLTQKDVDACRTALGELQWLASWPSKHNHNYVLDAICC